MSMVLAQLNRKGELEPEKATEATHYEEHDLFECLLVSAECGLKRSRA